MRNVTTMILLLSGLWIVSPSASRAQKWDKLLDLQGPWKFQLGDSARWSDPDFDDSKWDVIEVHGAWEDRGYPGYDGYAWYRKHFRVSSAFQSSVVYLSVGYVDDVSEIYLNGRMIGFAGRLPPDFYPGDGIYQIYRIPSEYFNYDKENVIAVRVFDLHLAGGMVRGSVGFYVPKKYLYPDYLLEGWWKFHTGDDPGWSEPSFDDSKWGEIMVPGYWETQGYRGYDGFGWYRLTFDLPDEFADESMILLLGKIDDIDETYLNGRRIGRTGFMHRDIERDELSTEWLEPRAYTIPRGLLKPGTNTIAVRVCDVWLHDGIYDGPVGLITRDHYLIQTDSPSFWERLFERIW